MRVLIVTNSASGRGRAQRLGKAISGSLEAWGGVPEVWDVREFAARGAAGNGALASFEAVIVVGGDGSVHHLLEPLGRSRLPVYHAPAGTENLFAREFRMSGEPDQLRGALRDRRIREVDVGLVGGRRFAIMLSVGPDAGVINRLHAGRTRGAGHAMYVLPTLAEAARPRLACLRVEVDGRELVSSRCGLLVVANCRQYARHLNPAAGADMGDGLLDVAFLPARTSAGLVRWAWRCWMGGRVGECGGVEGRGREVLVETDRRAPWQCDGETGGWIEAASPLRIAVVPQALRVLSP